MTTQATIRRRVNRGAAVLDEKLGKGNWEQKITKDLRMAGAHSCVLGQVFGEYWRGVRRLFGSKWYTESLETSHGFLANTDSTDYLKLEATWIRLLNERRKEI